MIFKTLHAFVFACFLLYVSRVCVFSLLLVFAFCASILLYAVCFLPQKNFSERRKASGKLKRTCWGSPKFTEILQAEIVTRISLNVRSVMRCACRCSQRATLLKSSLRKHNCGTRTERDMLKNKLRQWIGIGPDVGSGHSSSTAAGFAASSRPLSLNISDTSSVCGG